MPDDAPATCKHVGRVCDDISFTSDDDDLIFDAFEVAVRDLKAGHVWMSRVVVEAGPAGE